MKNRIMAFSLTLILLVSLVFSGCSNSISDSNKAEASNSGANNQNPDPKFLTIGTAATGGAYYPIGIAMADILTNKLGIQTTAQTTGGAVENNTLVEQKKADIAITHGSMAYNSVNGIEPYKEKYKNVSLMFSGLSKGVFQVLVNENSPIKTINDLKGKKVVMGPAGGGAITMTTDVFSVFGMTLDDISPIYVSYDDGVNDLTSGNVDAVVVQSAIPSPAIYQLTAAKKKIRLINLDESAINQLLEKFPYYAQMNIPKDAYGLQQDTATIYVDNVVVVNKSLSEDLVYNMTKLFFDNIDRITASHPAAKELTLENAVKNLPIPLHPGAEKYFKEKGVL